MIKLNCLSCGHSVDLGAAYEDYQGEVRCWACQTVLEVTLHEGRLVAMKRSVPSSSGRHTARVETAALATAAERYAASGEAK